MRLLGYRWLIRSFNLPERPLAVTSRLGTRLRTTHHADGSVEHEYPPHYAPEESVAGHLEFALRHEEVHLAVLFDLFRACGPAPISEAVCARPTSRYARLIGFYYELLTGERLNDTPVIGGNYLPALDPQRYFVAPTPVRDRRWRVWNNLLGDGRYCPLLRRTEPLAAALAAPLAEELTGLMHDFPPALLMRASDYLYLKETRSTYSLEREAMPRVDRAQRFVALLRQAGEGSLAALLSEAELTHRQHWIVDPRYVASGFRDHQNYVGEQRPDDSQRIHYVCPPPGWVAELMAGLAGAAERMAGLPALVRAAAVAFGFVFIHPFEDGNGRLHRFLIHDVLRRDGFIGPGVMLPVSATLLRRMAEYDAALERYSRPLMAGGLVYELDDEGRMIVLHPEGGESYYRFPDLTAQAEYLAATVAITIREDLAEELRFLHGYDAARRGVREIVDLPDRRLDLLLRLLHQNGGRLSITKRSQFAELADGEVAQIEEVFAEAFRGWKTAPLNGTEPLRAAPVPRQ
jgi:hypothetical protein